MAKMAVKAKTEGKTKTNKKEEQKKMMVRITCLVLVVALAVTSLLAVFPALFHDDDEYSIQEMLDAGIIYLGDDGNYYFTEEYINSIQGEAGE